MAHAPTPSSPLGRHCPLCKLVPITGTGIYVVGVMLPDRGWAVMAVGVPAPLVNTVQVWSAFYALV